MADNPEEIRKHMRLYTWVFVWLGVFTVVTVAVYKWVDVGAPGFTAGDATVGLLIAATKASLVALFFMHLISEKKVIYKFLVFTVFFCLGLMLLTLFATLNPIEMIFDVY